MNKTSIGLILIAIVVFVASCSTTNSPQPVNVVKDAKVAIAVPSLPQNFNPNVSQGYGNLDQSIMNLVFPQVFSIGGDSQPHLDTAVVSQAEVVGVDPQIVIYHLNPTAKWSDGVPVTPFDFTYNWEAHSGIGLDVNDQPFQSAPEPGWADIASVVGSIADDTVTVTFSKPYADWESLFSNLVPSHIAMKYGWNNGFRTFSPNIEVSAGPFEMSKMVANSEIILKENPYYAGQKPAVAEIIFKVIPPQDDYSALTSNEVNLVYGMSSWQTEQQLSENKRFSTSLVSSYNAIELVINANLPGLANLNLRKFLISLVDAQQVTNDTVGLEIPQQGRLGSLVALTQFPGYSNDAPPFATYDQRQVTALMEQASLLQTSSGVVVNSSLVPVGYNLLFDSNNPNEFQSASLIQSEFQMAGIALNLTPVSNSSDEVNALNSNSFDLALVNVTENPFVSYSLSSLVDSTKDFQITPGSGWPMYRSISFDPSLGTDAEASNLALKAEGELDTLTGQKYYQQVDALLWQDAISVPLFEESMFFAYDSTLTNVDADVSIFGPTWDAQNWIVTPVSSSSTSTSQ